MLFPVLFGCSVTAFASGASIHWPGWTVSSTEELSEGVKYPLKWNAPRYSMMRLFDGDLKTAWVYNASSREFDTRIAPTRYAVQLEPEQPVALDEVRLVNGHNFSPGRFAANHRAQRVRITLSNGKARRVYVRSLEDRMGWQSVHFPGFRASIITLEFPRIQRSSNRGADFCLSEIELRNSGRTIEWKMPRLVMYYDGLEGDADPSLLVRRDGVPLDGVAIDAGYQDSWSPSGRFVSGVAGEEDRLWIYDAVTEAKIAQTHPPKTMSERDRQWLRQLPKSNVPD